MIRTISPQDMREMERAFLEGTGYPSILLMEHAAQAVVDALSAYAKAGSRVLFVCGSGNNGGDGYALAAILAGKGIPCQLYRVSEKFSADGTFYYDQAIEAGVPADVFTKETDLSGYDILVDCLLGTGFNGPVRGLFYEAIQAINQSKAYVISVDINSGMNGDTGKGGPVVKSDLTVTIGYLKAGMLLGDAVWSIGKLVVADIGIRLIRDDYFLAKPEEALLGRGPCHHPDPRRGRGPLQSRPDHPGRGPGIGPPLPPPGPRPGPLRPGDRLQRGSHPPLRRQRAPVEDHHLRGRGCVHGYRRDPVLGS